VLALGGDSLAFPSDPKDLVQTVRRLLGLARALASFLGWISVRTHPDLLRPNPSLTRRTHTPDWRGRIGTTALADVVDSPARARWPVGAWGALFVIFAGFFPRVALVIVWIATDLVDRALSTCGISAPPTGPPGHEPQCRLSAGPASQRLTRSG
jgi:hypothetical protein